MKKLKLNLAGMLGTQVLTRQQLKSIIGGDWGSGSDEDGKKCTGECGGGDKHTWKASCSIDKYFKVCTCPNNTASWSTCSEK